MADDLQRTGRGRVLARSMRGNAIITEAIVPLANMFGDAEALGLLSHKHGTLTMAFDHYASVSLPKDDPPFRPAIGMRA